jgi:hypothetical protein
MKLFEKYFRRQKFKNLVRAVNEAIYSERFEMKSILQLLTSNFQEAKMLQAYLAIEVATTLSEPLTKADIDNALEIISSAEHHIHEGEQFENILELHRSSAEYNWKKKTEFITNGKRARKRDKYSYEAAIYDLEKIKKAPCSSKEREKWKALSISLKESEHKYKVAEEEYKEAVKKQQDENDEKASKAAAEAAFQRIIAEVEEEKKLHGEKSKEQILKERDEIMGNIKAKLTKIRDENKNGTSS